MLYTKLEVSKKNYKTVHEGNLRKHNRKYQIVWKMFL